MGCLLKTRRHLALISADRTVNEPKKSKQWTKRGREAPQRISHHDSFYMTYSHLILLLLIYWLVKLKWFRFSYVVSWSWWSHTVSTRAWPNEVTTLSCFMFYITFCILFHINVYCSILGLHRLNAVLRSEERLSHFRWTRLMFNCSKAKKKVLAYQLFFWMSTL